MSLLTFAWRGKWRKRKLLSIIGLFDETQVDLVAALLTALLFCCKYLFNSCFISVTSRPEKLDAHLHLHVRIIMMPLMAIILPCNMLSLCSYIDANYVLTSYLASDVQKRREFGSPSACCQGLISYPSSNKFLIFLKLLIQLFGTITKAIILYGQSLFSDGAYGFNILWGVFVTNLQQDHDGDEHSSLGLMRSKW